MKKKMTRWQRLANDYRFTLGAWEQDRFYDGKSMVPRFLFFPLYVWLTVHGWYWNCIGQSLAIWWCEKFQHDWVDNGYAGPESGAIIMDCRRCGAGHQHILY